MDDFDLARLTDFDFEALCKDLLEEIVGVRFEIFAKGADGGVDLRHLADDEHLTVVQCKHWIKSGRSALIRHIETHEAAKVHALRPRRYVLATSADLTVSAKRSLAQALSPYSREGDIFGLQEIVAELRKRPHLVRRHMRLWLAGTGILQALLNKAIITRSAFLQLNLESTLRKYAPNRSFYRARDLLNSRHVCVISGIPGIGKTTLAQVMCAYYVAQGYELYEVSSDAEEVNTVWDDARPQLFYYDDFLGQKSLGDKLHKNEDARLLNLIGRVTLSPNKLLIMTTRGYLLEQARQDYERLARQDFNPLTCVLDLSDYSAEVRASILYNHVYFSDLPRECKAAFAPTSVHEPILDHPNFNPRLIENSLEIAKHSSLTPGETVRLVFANLQDPAKVWDHLFHRQIGSIERGVLEVLLFLPRETSFASVATAWQKYWAAKVGHAENRQLLDALRLLSGTMVRLAGPRLSVVSFQNPSVADFMRAILRSRPQMLLDCLAQAAFFEQVEIAWNLAKRDQRALSADDLRPLFEESILRTLDNGVASVDLYRTTVDRVHRLGVVLEIAESLGSNRLSWLAYQRLRGLDIGHEAAHRDEAAAVVLASYGSRYQRLRRLAPALAERLAADLTHDMTEWNAADTAVRVLETLRDLSVEGQLAAAHNAREEAARRIIEQLANRGLGSTREVDMITLYEILDYAREWDDPIAFAPHLPEVWESIEIVDREDEFLLWLADHGTATPSAAAPVWDITAMFSLLADS
jgi:hypothetical protein